MTKLLIKKILFGGAVFLGLICLALWSVIIGYEFIMLGYPVCYFAAGFITQV